MRIIQMLPTLAYGDAIGNDVLALDQALRMAGYDTDIYAENLDKRLPNGVAKNVKKYKDNKENVILFHLSIGSGLAEQIMQFSARVIIIYHNVTPAEFWKGYSVRTEKLSEEGLICVKNMRARPQMCIADSEFNKQELIRLGYQCPIEVLPILIAFEDYDKTPNKAVIEQYSNDGYTNILFTGRIAPNKKQEDIIAAFYYYKNYINPKSRLFIVGSYQNTDIYYNKLRNYVEELELNDVVFTGHISFDEILAYYHLADLFLCLSEHEGFCVPLVEAMYFGIPVIAYDSTAVGETLGGSGLLLGDKNPQLVAEAVNKVISDTDLREKMVCNEKVRLKDFSNDKIQEHFLKILKKYIG